MTSLQFLVAFVLLQISPLHCSAVHPYYVGLKMGTGAYAVTNQFFGLALQNFSTNTWEYGQQSRWKFRSVSNSRELIELLDVGIAGAFQNWAAHTSPLAQFAQDIAINKYSTYFLLQLVIEVSEENIVRPQLSEEAEYYVEQYGLAEFQNIYGREYLDGRINGGVFLGLITVHTLSAAEKHTMIDGLKFSSSGTGLTPCISIEAQKILENRQVEITTKQIFGQPQLVISTFDEMIDKLKKFPDLAVKYPVPIYGIFNEYKKSIAYSWQGAGVANDYQNQDDVLFELSTQATNLKDRKSNLEYVQKYYDMFEEFQVGNESDRTEFLDQKSIMLKEVSQEINQINIENIKINRAATSCVTSMERCSVQTLSYKPVFELPEQQYGDVVLKAEVIVEEMFLQAQKEINNSLFEANSQVQSNINNNNKNIEQAISNATTKFNNLLSQAQESVENMNSQVQQNINNTNQNLDQAVFNASTNFNDLLSQAQAIIDTNNQNLKYAVSNATKDIEGMFSVNTAMIYYGDINDIPSGWQLCDGSNLNGVKIPDLRGRFPLGQKKGDSHATPIGKIGGSFQKTLTEKELPSHTHDTQYRGHTTPQYYANDDPCMYGDGTVYSDSSSYYCGLMYDTTVSGNNTHIIDSAGQSGADTGGLLGCLDTPLISETYLGLKGVGKGCQVQDPIFLPSKQSNYGEKTHKSQTKQK